MLGRADDGTSGMRVLCDGVNQLTDLALFADRFRGYVVFELGGSWEDAHLSMSFSNPDVMSH